MEILFEMDCGIDVEFIPDWRMSTKNHADHSQVQWQLSHFPNKRCLDDVFTLVPEELSISREGDCLDSLRLLYGYN